MMGFDHEFETNAEVLATGMRRCGTCGEVKPVAHFYRDGKDGHGNPRYRRDCKDCYKLARLHNDAIKAKKEGIAG